MPSARNGVYFNITFKTCIFGTLRLTFENNLFFEIASPSGTISVTTFFLLFLLDTGIRSVMDGRMGSNQLHR